MSGLRSRSEIVGTREPTAAAGAGWLRVQEERSSKVEAVRPGLPGWGAVSVRAWAPGHRGGVVGGERGTAKRWR